MRAPSAPRSQRGALLAVIKVRLASPRLLAADGVF
jgi:hypothetical protein